MSIRFRPKSRASMDQMPGPSIAKAAPVIASTIQVRRLSALERAVHSSTITTNPPATGVKRPIEEGRRLGSQGIAVWFHATRVPSAFRRLHHGPGQFRPLTAGVED